MTKLKFDQIKGMVISVTDKNIVADGITDNTATWVTLESTLVDGDTVYFPAGNYVGTFHTKKAINFTFDKKAKLVNSSASGTILRIGPESSDFTAHAVTESTLNVYDYQFTVPSASTKFSEGDIGYLWDNAQRPSDDEAINFETVKIADITGDVITVEGFIRSYKGTGSIVFYHSTIQPKDISVKGFNAEPDNTHTGACLLVWGCDGVDITDSRTLNSTGNAVGVRYSYDVSIVNTRPRKPRLTTSGYGYGVALIGVTSVTVRDLFGLRTRHVLDADSVYDFTYENIHEPDDQSAPVMLAHEGCAGFGDVSGVFVKTKQYPVNFSESGFGSGAGRAEKQNHPLRNVNIRNIHARVDETVVPDANGTFGVYLQCNVDEVNIENVSVNFLNTAALSAAAASNIVRVNGCAVGAFNVRNLSANKIGRFFFSTGDRDSAAIGDNLSCIENCSATDIREPIRVQGLWSLSVDKLFMDNVLGDQIIYMQSTGVSDDPLALYVGSTIHYKGTIRKIFDTSVTVDGEFSQISRDSNTAVSVVASYNVTAEEVQNRGKLLSLTAPVGASSITLGDFPTPYIDGQQITIRGWKSGRDDIVIPGSLSTIAADITFDSTNPDRVLVADGGVWRELNL